jgi:hypothetical protein
MTTKRNKKNISITISYDLWNLIEEYREILRRESGGAEFGYSAEFETQMGITVCCRLLAREFPFACAMGDPVDYESPEYEDVVASRSTSRLYEYLRREFERAHGSNSYDLIRMGLLLRPADKREKYFQQLRSELTPEQCREFDELTAQIVACEGGSV